MDFEAQPAAILQETEMRPGAVWRGDKSLYPRDSSAYDDAMQPHTGRGRKWRRFRHKYGLAFGISCLVLVALALVVLLMYLLTSTSWLKRY